MAQTRSSQLADAVRTRQLVRLKRRFEGSSICGYVLDVGPKFFLLALVSDRIRFDGFECFRISDVREVKTDPYAAFVKSALRKRGERRPKKPRVSIASIEELLVSAGRAFPLVTIHREEADAHVCWIGQIRDVGRSHVSLLGIAPGAKWYDKPDKHRLSEITRVNFGGDYEGALYLVGGDPGER